MGVNEVILVNEHDQSTGTMEKLEAHRRGLLHRAFSIFVFNSQGHLLLQQRAQNKYHSGGLWTNTCCSHPAPDQKIEDSAAQRLYEEMGFNTPLRKMFEFTYRADFDNGLTEHEYDHVFAGNYDGPVSPNPEEVKDYCFKSIDEIQFSLQMQPQKYTAWFKIAFPRVMEWVRGNKILNTAL